MYDGALESVAVLWRLRSHRDIIIIIIIINAKVGKDLKNADQLREIWVW